MYDDDIKERLHSGHCQTFRVCFSPNQGLHRYDALALGLVSRKFLSGPKYANNKSHGGTWLHSAHWFDTKYHFTASI